MILPIFKQTPGATGGLIPEPDADPRPLANPGGRGFSPHGSTAAMFFRPPRAQVQRRIAVVAALTLVACLLTYYFHVILNTGKVFSHLFYVPIILSALWWQRRGMLTALFLSGALLASSGMLRPEMMSLSDGSRVLMFLVVGWIVVRQSERISVTEAALRYQAGDLEKRVCELGCLYGIEALRDDRYSGLNDIMQGIVDLLPRFWRHAPLSGVEIYLRHHNFRSSRFSATNRLISRPIFAEGKEIGQLCVFHAEHRPCERQGCPSTAETQLLKAIAGRIGRIVEHESAKRLLRQHQEKLEALVVRRTQAVVRAHEKLKAEMVEHRQARKALEESEEKYRHLVENAGDAIVLVQDGRIRFANPKASQLLHRSADQLLETTPLDWIHPEDWQALKDRYAIRTGVRARPFAATFRLLPGAAAEIWVQATMAPTRLNDRPAAIVFLRDVSLQRMMERRMQQAHKMAAIGTLASGIAHRFNNALAGLSGAIELLQHKRSADPEVQHQSDAMLACVRIMAQLTGQLLAYARGGKYNPVLIDLNVHVSNCLPSIRPVLGPAVSVHTELAGQACMVAADATQIQMVLLAVMQNAVEAMGERGRLVIRTRRQTVEKVDARRCQGFRPGKYAVLEVEDNGHGMDRQTVAKIFEPFFSTKYPGRGLAMAAVYGIIKNHGGWIGIDSELGTGTRVRIFLPLASDAKDDQEP